MVLVVNGAGKGQAALRRFAHPLDQRGKATLKHRGVVVHDGHVWNFGPLRVIQRYHDSLVHGRRETLVLPVVVDHNGFVYHWVVLEGFNTCFEIFVRSIVRDNYVYHHLVLLIGND